MTPFLRGRAFRQSNTGYPGFGAQADGHQRKLEHDQQVVDGDFDPDDLCGDVFRNSVRTSERMNFFMDTGTV